MRSHRKTSDLTAGFKASHAWRTCGSAACEMKEEERRIRALRLELRFRMSESP